MIRRGNGVRILNVMLRNRITGTFWRPATPLSDVCHLRNTKCVLAPATGCRKEIQRCRISFKGSNFGGRQLCIICHSNVILCTGFLVTLGYINPLTPNDNYSGLTAPLTSKRFILYIYSTNIGTEYFEHGIYSPFFSLQNAVCFIILTYLVPVLFIFYVQDVLKFKKIIPAPKC